MTTTVSKRIISLMLLASLSLLVITVHCVELEVGGSKTGWATPSPKNVLLYNDWASSNRFKVNDTLRFEYKKDSVLVVTEQEYEKCRSSHPIFFSNSGDTAFTLDHPGLFYFISGVSGHCERGLKMVVKVIEPVELEPPPRATNATTRNKSAAPNKITGSFMVLPVGFTFILVVGSSIFM